MKFNIINRLCVCVYITVSTLLIPTFAFFSPFFVCLFVCILFIALI